MDFIYTPEGMDEPKLRVSFAPNKMLNAEAEIIERKTGMKFPEWADAVHEGSMIALHALLFTMLKRLDPTTTWDKVVFNASEVDFELTDAEHDDLVTRLEEMSARGGTLSLDQIGFLQAAKAKAAERDEATPVDPDAPVVVDGVGEDGRPVGPDPTTLESEDRLTLST